MTKALSLLSSVSDLPSYHACPEWGFPVVEAEGDIIKKTPFENGQDSAWPALI